VFAVGLVLATPAFAGACFQQAGALRCADGTETLILQGLAADAVKPGERFILQSDGQGNTFGLIGNEKLMIVRAQGMMAGKLGSRRLICVEGGPGVTMCK
jgi:hypothetical protein